MERAAVGLRELCFPAAVVSSPYLRAAQTAEVLQSAFDLQGLHFTDSLVSGDHDALLWELGRFDAPEIAVVGHMPDILGMLSLLVTGRPETLSADFGKGTAAMVDCPGKPAPGTGRLEWMLPAKALRAIARGAE